MLENLYILTSFLTINSFEGTMLKELLVKSKIGQD